MTLYEITKIDCSGVHTKRLGTIEQEELSVGDMIEYQTDEGTAIQIGTVEKQEFEFDDSTWQNQTHYKVGSKSYCIGESSPKAQ